MRLRITTLGTALSLVAGPLCAQGEIGAFLGVLAPTSTFVLPTLGPYGAPEAKLQTEFTYGGVARYWFRDRFGAQVTYSAGQGSLVVYPTLGFAPDSTYDATTSALTVQFLYALTTPSLPNTVWASIGPVWASFDSPRFDALTVASDLGVAFGVGSTLPILERRLLVNFMLDGMVYGLSFADSTGQESSGSQFAVRAVVGISVPIGH